jgi:hypothetical protein
VKVLKDGVILKPSGGMTDVFDNVVKQLFNITDDEYDFIAGESTDEELDIIMDALGGSKAPFSLRRQALEIRNKYLKLKNETEWDI